MRYTCDDPAFAGDFIEFSDRWSRAQVRSAWDAVPDTVTDSGPQDDGALLDVLRPKIVALHLTCVDATPITDPSELTPERTTQIDTVLYSWFASVWIRHLQELSDLGNALGRKLFALPDTSKEATTDALHHQNAS